MKQPSLTPETTFTADLSKYASDKKHYLDENGQVRNYKDLVTTFAPMIKPENRVTIPMTPKTTDISGVVGLSNVNWGHIAVNELNGANLLDDLQWTAVSSAKTDDTVSAMFMKTLGVNTHKDPYANELLLKSELTSSLVEVLDENCSEEETQWQCKGCSKYFATKSSLKRHHERKKSCKELNEMPKGDVSGATPPEKPYIVEWVDELTSKAISGDSDKPYCKHCDVEFANKANLNKHLSKSVACDKLAKQEFVKLLQI
jgi:hypothetical protein